MKSRPSLDAFRYASAVVRSGSFSRAAAELGVSQPALSNGVARLEEQLGEKLFDRSPRGASLTGFGREAAPLIERVLAAAEDVTALARSWDAARSGYIRVGVSPLIDGGLVAAVHRRLAEHTDALPLLTEANMVDLQSALRAGELDVVLVPSVVPLPGFEHRVIGSEQLVVVAPEVGDSVGRETGNAPCDVCDLTDRRLILVPDACGLTAFTRDLFSSHGIELMKYPGEPSSYRMLEEWARLGLGTSLVPRSKLRDPDAPHSVLCDGDVEVEIFYEVVWDPRSPFAGVVETTASDIGA